MTQTTPPRGDAALAVRQLTVTGFRNYRSLRLDVTDRPVVLTGPNGAGKTNLLEALSLLVPGRGLRGVAYEELLGTGADAWAINVEACASTGTMRLATGWPAPGRRAHDAAPLSRQVRIDGEVQRSPSVLGQHLRIVWLTPAMDRLFTGPSSDRRRYLDRMVAAFDPLHGTRVQAFERSLRERNKLLAEVKFDTAWLTALEGQIAQSAVAIAVARVHVIEALSAIIREARGGLPESPFPWAGLAIDGALEHRVGLLPAVQAEDEYRTLLCDSRGVDQAAGRTLNGPHRSDFLVTHGPKHMLARKCSTGEQKALLIGLILAQARALRSLLNGWAPVLLLDEVAAHLDAERRAGLFAEICDLGCQAWMTGTDRALFEGGGDDWTVCHVEEGHIDVRQ